MRVLGIDTALGACSAALVEDGHVRARAFTEMARGHAEALAPMVDRVMRESGCAFAQLDRIGVTTGPGTFTGQRVGLAFARGLALALKRPAVGVTTLDAMAAEVLAATASPWAAIVADAKREEVYLGARVKGGATLVAPALLAVADALELLVSLASSSGSDFALGGTAAEAFAARLTQWNLAPRPTAIRQPDALFVAILAGAAPEPQEPPRPLYLRAPDAKLPGTV
jgi:tRNA threonylcarbamoyl adenosine modification protein YeaZ